MKHIFIEPEFYDCCTDWIFLFSHVALIHGLSSLMGLDDSDNKSHIVYVSSVQSVIALPERSGYSASKFAVSGLCDSLRAEVRILMRILNEHLLSKE